jgi:hypothetical protein
MSMTGTAHTEHCYCQHDTGGNRICCHCSAQEPADAALVAGLRQDIEFYKAERDKADNRYMHDEQEFEARTAALVSQLSALVQQWRKQATQDAKYATSQAMQSPREYFGTANAALAFTECADELSALLAASRPGAKEKS